MPKKPHKYPKKIYINLDILQWKLKEKSGIAKEARPVIETIIVNIGLTILASTAAWPNIKAPTIPMVGPIAEGIRKPPSLISSNENSISNNSTIIGKGTDSLEATIVNSNSVGITLDGNL